MSLEDDIHSKTLRCMSENHRYIHKGWTEWTHIAKGYRGLYTTVGNFLKNG